MEQHLEITADAVSRMPRERLLAAWTVLTEAVVEQALVSVSPLLDLPEIGASLDERITESVETARQLEGAAAAVLMISRSADALVRVMAAEHAEAVRQVEALGLDTYAREEDFYSFRRATHRGSPSYGRQISLIGLPPRR